MFAISVAVAGAARVRPGASCVLESVESAKTPEVPERGLEPAGERAHKRVGNLLLQADAVGLAQVLDLYHRLRHVWLLRAA